MCGSMLPAERGGFLVKRAVRGGGGPRKKKATAEDADGADDDDVPATEPSTGVLCSGCIHRWSSRTNVAEGSTCRALYICSVILISK